MASYCPEGVGNVHPTSGLSSPTTGSGQGIIGKYVSVSYCYTYTSQEFLLLYFSV